MNDLKAEISLREAEAIIIKLRSALVGLIGASTKEELQAMELVLRNVPAPDVDRIAALNAIHVLIETAGNFLPAMEK